MTATDPLVAGIELGGTKCIAAIARGRDILRSARFPTRQPDETIAALLSQLAEWQSDFAFEAIGIASFGPIVLNAAASDFGSIVSTPKSGWSGVDIRAAVAERFALPISLDTDVGGAALAEGKWGNAVGCGVHAYVTIGTGVGVGIVIDGKVLHGALHPEAGHIRVQRAPSDRFPGSCPFHGDCLEGLVSGPAIAARAGKPADMLLTSDPIWHHIAGEIASLTTVLILTLSPHRIVIGGGVVEHRPMLLTRIHAATAENLNGYLPDRPDHDVQRRVVPPKLGGDAGPLGAIALGLTAL